MNLDSFVEKQLELIELEKQEDIEETKCLHEKTPAKDLEHQGVLIRKLKLEEKKSGLYGRTLVEFGPQWPGKGLPAHHISSGDIVGICNNGDHSHSDVIVSGVVSATKSNLITVAFELTIENLPLEDSTIYNVVKLANDITYKRIKNALLELKKIGESGQSHLIDVLYGKCSISEQLKYKAGVLLINFLDKNLNESQREAVIFALCQREVAIIHGPPGTGKTTTLIEVIRQLVNQKLRVLVCAPSNVAVDNIAEKLIHTEVKIVRLGHPARTSMGNQNVSLDAMLQRSDISTLIEDIRKELDATFLAIRSTRDKGEKRQKRPEIKELTRELRSREISAVKEVLTNVDVVLATLVSAYPGGPLKHLPKDYFDVVVIDECSQALEAACLIPILQAKKCIIAGDHKQLPPTIISKKAASSGLEITLMERLLSFPQMFPGCCHMLNTQYRMHKVIMKWPSDQLYERKLIAHPSVESHLLKDLPGVETSEETSIPLLLIDTAGCDFYELDLEDEISKGNEDEARLVSVHLKNLIRNGVHANDIAVITPYNLQVELIRSLTSQEFPGVEIRSVDGFQGREKEAVIFSFVRSNSKGEVGFLAENRRLNVSITRARRHLAVVCDSETVSHDPFLKEFIDYVNQVGEVRSAHQYQSSMPVNTDHLEIVTKKIIKAKAKGSSDTRKLQSTAASNTSTKPIKPSPSLNVNKKETLSEEHNLRTKYKEILDNFKQSDTEKTYSFPSTLNSFERRLVHEIAEKLGLLHISQGEGEQRHISISKTTNKSQRPPKVKQEISSESPTMAVKIETIEKSEDKDSDVEPAVLTSTKPKPSKKKKSKKSAGIQQINPEQEHEDLNDVFNEFVSKNNICCYKLCKTSTAVLRQICALCGRHFCFSHSLPEVHGCGDAAKVEARKNAFRNFEKDKFASTTFGQIKSVNRKTLERKLDKKLGELNDKRSRKPPKANK
ncbi:DNA-binding protein SMUBP-2 [Chamberlinius hualienensis]